MADIDDLMTAVAAGPQGPEIGAFFDFDGTLLHGYSAALYFRQRLSSRSVSPQELIGTLVEVFNMQQRGHDVTRLVGVGLGALRGTALTDLEEMGQQLFRSRISGQLFPDARRLVRAHLRAGHTVALASSATRFQAQAAAQDLGIEHLLVTEVETLDGIVTGKVDGPILWGRGRPRRCWPSAPNAASTCVSPTPTATGERTSSTSRPSGAPDPSTPTARSPGQLRSAAGRSTVCTVGGDSPRLTSRVLLRPSPVSLPESLPGWGWAW